MPSPVRILQIIPRLDAGGAELATLEISQAIIAAGWQAMVLSEGGRLAARLEEAGAEFLEFPASTKNPMKMARNALAIARLVREKGVSLVHARSRGPAWSALLAARNAGVPFVTTYHGAYGERSWPKNLYNSVMARGDIVIANSDYMARVIRSRHAVPDKRLRVVNRGVDLDQFDPDKLTRDRIRTLRQAWGVGPQQRIVLHPARLTAWKGQEIVIKAAARLKDEEVLRDVVFVLAGDDQGRSGYRRDLDRLIQDRGLDAVVRIVGHCSDMPAAFAAAHVTLMPSIEPEAFGRSTAEAQAMGCPVIASRTGASPDVIRGLPDFEADQATGWLVERGDAPDLAAALADALGMPEAERMAMGRRARTRIVNNFGLERMKSGVLDAYRELLRIGPDQAPAREQMVNSP